MMTIEQKILEVFKAGGDLSEIEWNPDTGFSVHIIRTIACPNCNGTGQYYYGGDYGMGSCNDCDGGRRIYAGTKQDEGKNPFCGHRIFGNDFAHALEFLHDFYASDQSIYMD